MTDPNAEYNPLDYDNLTKNLVDELMRRPPHALPLPAEFNGAGVYALFYDGSFSPYKSLRSAKADRPIYVGKAVPEGARKGRPTDDRAVGKALYKRIAEHVSSIVATENLSLKDFQCRYLVVTPLWITMAERFLIENYRPLWNVCVEGFGIHDPGSGRYEGEISWWDALHPGRPFAKKQKQTKTAAVVEKKVREFLSRPEAYR